jgi:predicted phosphodiesterase
MIHCPKCGWHKVHKNGKREGRQRYKCASYECKYEWVDEEIKGTGNVCAFSCAHLPFGHPNYLEFIQRVVEEQECDTIINLGDFFDNHAISYHESDPDGMAAGEEFKRAREEAQKWVEAFPHMMITYGNHDLLVRRQAKTTGFPGVCVRTPNEIWGLPDTWEWHDRIVIDNVVYHHGTGKSGKYMHANWALENMMNSVTGHGHSNAGVHVVASHRSLLWGLGVGCGIDIHSYAMAYGRDFGKRPILGCGVIKDNGRLPIFVPMNM